MAGCPSPGHYATVADHEGQHGPGGSASTLVGFLLSRLAEDERLARAAQAGGSAGTAGTTGGQPVADPRSAHSARHDPARVLREVAAKRAMVRAWVEAMQEQLAEHTDTDFIVLCELALAHFAAVYSDHPEYRPAWLPADRSAADPGRAQGPSTGPRTSNVIALRSKADRGRRA
jgi:hypothetical protein